MHPLGMSLGIRWGFGRVAFAVLLGPCRLRSIRRATTRRASRIWHMAAARGSRRDLQTRDQGWWRACDGQHRSSQTNGLRSVKAPGSPSLPRQQLRQGCRELGQRQPHTRSAAVLLAMPRDRRLQEPAQQLGELPPAAVIHRLCARVPSAWLWAVAGPAAESPTWRRVWGRQIASRSRRRPAAMAVAAGTAMIRTAIAASPVAIATALPCMPWPSPPMGSGRSG